MNCLHTSTLKLLLMVAAAVTLSSCGQKTDNAVSKDTLQFTLPLDTCEIEPDENAIPANARLMDICCGYELYLSTCDTTAESPYKASLFSLDIKTKESKLLLTTLGHEVRREKDDTVAFKLPKSEIPALFSVEILYGGNGSLLLGANGPHGPNYNETYIISEDKDSVICIPYTSFIGFSVHEALVITQTFDHYGQGSTYGVLKVFDLEGNLTNWIPLNQETNVPFNLYFTAWDKENWNCNLDSLQQFVRQHPGATEDELIRLGRKRFGSKQQAQN